MVLLLQDSSQWPRRPLGRRGIPHPSAERKGGMVEGRREMITSLIPCDSSGLQAALQASSLIFDSYNCMYVSLRLRGFLLPRYWLILAWGATNPPTFCFVFWSPSVSICTFPASSLLFPSSSELIGVWLLDLYIYFYQCSIIGLMKTANYGRWNTVKGISEGKELVSKTSRNTLACCSRKRTGVTNVINYGFHLGVI